MGDSKIENIHIISSETVKQLILPHLRLTDALPDASLPLVPDAGEVRVSLDHGEAVAALELGHPAPRAQLHHHVGALDLRAPCGLWHWGEGELYDVEGFI